ncbi:hypothetical protein HanXRQr2_Chr11g0487331 [Helianthus annuus]|uniref:Uncharacterized protein n=1 Tax=Helianthus annuus TaxID=4232 RepID=A0A251VIF6_HELAN|nr:hypothetical protein HanXRQr2_Chr11g0487331 [Helianthus annuus]
MFKPPDTCCDLIRSKNPIEHHISFIFINFCNLQTLKHVPIRFAQPSWIFLVFLIFHSVINKKNQ